MTMRGAALGIAAGWLLIFAAVTLFRPLMPVDETRYLTVAWEMLYLGNWVLPTLNFEPYSHKPPLLFWLIRTGWEIFGVSVTSARVLIFAAVGVLFYLVARLARTLFAQEDSISVHAILALAAMPAFLVYANVIMFDSLLAVFITAAMLSLWQAGQTNGSLRFFLLCGVLLGMGILTKGPVALVYGLPVALLGPLWLCNVSRARWYGGVLLAVLTAASIGLAWAIPAAIEGGPAYTQKIFITQSAGRMVQAFDHVEPFWFYIPVLAGFLLPFLLWPRLWSALRAQFRGAWQTPQIRFLLCWIVPAIVFFSTISSKSIHYMAPILPGIVILFVYFLRNHAPERILRWMAAASFAVVITAHAVLGVTLFPRYDLAPIITAVEPHTDHRPLATAPKYDGEYGFFLRPEHVIASIGREEVQDWFEWNPNGILIGRYKQDSVPADYSVLFTHPFRRNEVLVVMERKEKSE